MRTPPSAECRQSEKHRERRRSNLQRDAAGTSCMHSKGGQTHLRASRGKQRAIGVLETGLQKEGVLLVHFAEESNRRLRVLTRHSE